MDIAGGIGGDFRGSTWPLRGVVAAQNLNVVDLSRIQATGVAGVQAATLRRECQVPTGTKGAIRTVGDPIQGCSPAKIGSPVRVLSGVRWIVLSPVHVIGGVGVS